MNICKKIFEHYTKEYNDEYKNLENKPVEQYEKLISVMFVKEINQEINKYKFIEQGRAFIKHNTVNNDESNKLYLFKRI